MQNYTYFEQIYQEYLKKVKNKVHLWIYINIIVVSVRTTQRII